MSLIELDCQRCGACCFNPTENREHGYTAYVKVFDRDRIRAKPELMRRFTILDDDGVPHLRMTPDGRCQALRGALGSQVRCTIYHDRPTPCRQVELGSELC